jgi:hypothetical protein
MRCSKCAWLLTIVLPVSMASAAEPAAGGDFQGQPLAAKIVFTDTFVRRGNDWVAVASQRTAAR